MSDDVYVDPVDVVEAWSRPIAFQELCETNVRFILGEIPGSPSSCGPICEETKSIAPSLIALNRMGLLTTGSQPGEGIIDRCGQRAWVEGLAPKEVALALATKTLHSGLLIFAIPPGGEFGGYRVPITIDDGHPHTWVGHLDFDERSFELELFGRICRPEIVETLAGMWSVIAVDPEWGRVEYLWETLLAPDLPDYSPIPFAYDGEGEPEFNV